MDGSGTTGLVLAGGGTKGSFEAGAVSYLVEQAGLAPEVIAGTSAGSICAAVLAQARTHREFVQRAAELQSDLLAMTHADMVFGKQPWVGALDGTPFGTAINGFIVDRTRPAVPGDHPSAPGPPPAPAPAAPPASRRRARRRELALEVARSLPNLQRARRSFKGNSGSLLTLEPLGRALRHGGQGIQPVDPELIARPGLELRLAVSALGAGALRYVTGDGTIVGADARTPVPGAGSGPVDVLEGVLASASVPMIFPPRRLATDVYVDGGVANNIPVEAAVAMGATRIFAVLAVPLEQAHDPRDFTEVNGVGVFLRSAGAVAFGERQRANLNVPRPPGTSLTVIDPLVDVVSPFEVSQGLMVLNMDYGWMRASDVVAPLPDPLRERAHATTHALTVARVRAWHREEALFGGGATGEQVRELVAAKRAIGDAVAERRELGLPLPAGADRWASGYEEHGLARPPELPENPLELAGRA